MTIARLGTWQTTQELWKGRLDEIRVYNRPLDPSEVRVRPAALARVSRSASDPNGETETVLPMPGRV